MPNRMNVVSPHLQRLAARAPVLAHDEEIALAAAAKAGDARARDRIVLAHLRMAIAAAVKFRHYGVAADDLVQFGVEALIKALDKFDPAVGVRFSSFAAYTIKAHLSIACLKGSSTVQPPTDGRSKRVFFVGRFERHRIERDETLSQGQVDRRLAERLGVSVKAIEAISAAAFGGVSTNTPIRGDSDLEMGNTLPDEAETPDVVVTRVVDEERRARLLDAALTNLNDREREVLVARYRREDGDEATFAELSSRFGVSKQRVQQIEAKALTKMRASLLPRRVELGLAHA